MSAAKSFLQGALILIVAGFVNRIIGFAYRILAVRILGSEGIGLFEMVFPIYVLMLVITTAGVPIAISKMVSEQISLGNRYQAKKVFIVALLFLVVTGTVCMGILLLLSPWLMRTVLADPRVYWTLITLAPAILIVSVSSALRGYFQGMQRMGPPAVSQVVEQVVRIAVGVYMASKLLPLGIEFGVAGLAAGTVLGELAGLVFMTAVFYVGGRTTHRVPGKQAGASLSTSGILTSIFTFSIPVSLSRLNNSGLLALQAVIIPQRLQAAGYTLRQATEIFGQFSGIAMALLGLPTIITFSLAITLVPAISETAARKDYRLLQSRTWKAIQVSTMAGFPAAVVFFLLPHQLCQIIFGTPQAGDSLRVMAFGCIFLYLAQTTSGILQGMGKVGVYLRNSLVGSALNIAGIYFLTSLPSYGIRGTAIGMNIGWIAVSLMNVISVYRYAGISFSFRRFFLLPLAGATAMGMVIYFSFACFLVLTNSSLFSTLGSLSVGCLFYSIFLLASGTITREDIARLPGLGFLHHSPTL